MTVGRSRAGGIGRGWAAGAAPASRVAGTNLATRDPLLQGVVFPPQVVDEVTEFMTALTDPAARNLRRLVPQRVPSALPVDDARGSLAGP